MKHDVIVVGAGPAGSTAAADLARRGRDVLLVDRHAFPRDKICGDGIPPGTAELLGRIGMKETIADAGFYPIHGLRLGSSRGRVWETRLRPRRPGLEFLIAPRIRFDALVREQAIACGAAFERATVTAVHVEGGRVTGVRLRGDGGERSVSAGVVVGADGATSIVARALGQRRTPATQRDVAIRAYADGFDIRPHTIEAYFQRRLVPGYGWVFPLGEGKANVGVIVRVDRFQRSGDTLPGLLDEFLNTPGIRERSRSARVSDAATWQLPLAVAPWRRRSFDGAVLVGDAGALVDPATGEGIHFAVFSALLAADAIDHALGAGRTDAAALSAYDAACERELGGLIRRSFRFHRWVAERPRVLESAFVLANALPGTLRSVLNRLSTDFVLHPAVE